MVSDSIRTAIRQAQRGDTRAFDLLVRHYQNAAVGYARTLLWDATAAEDAAQEAFVQAWRDLPGLNNPAAFAGWLRKIVFKYCDRKRRVTQPQEPLNDSLPASAESDPALVIERTEQRWQLWQALDALPCPLREATLLYYFIGQDVGEIAAFLEVPPSTIKNRLHSARKRLRKELWQMAETMMETEKPSQSGEFVGNVLVRIRREFEEQERRDPYTANRGLLEEGKSALFAHLTTSLPVDSETAHEGFLILWRKWDFAAMASFLMNYIGREPGDSETSWAYLHLANANALSGSAAGAVLAHEAFERWLPGRSPYLSSVWPYFPGDPATDENVLTEEAEIRMQFLGQSFEFATAYNTICRNADYLRKVDEVWARIVPLRRNLYLRLACLRMAGGACQAVQNLTAARRYIERIPDLAREADTDTERFPIKAHGLHDMAEVARGLKDYALFERCVQETMEIISAVESSGNGSAGWARGIRHNLAHHLYFEKRYEESRLLWEANAANGGQVGGWGHLLYATTVWVTTGDRERTLALLSDCRAHDDRDMVPDFQERPEFADVKDDPDFLNAISRR